MFSAMPLLWTLAACGEPTSSSDTERPTDTGPAPQTDTATDTGTDCEEAAWYPDADGDGFGDAALPTWACEQPPDTLTDGSDCDDDDPSVYPGALEHCDGIWSDCSQDWDDDRGRVTWFSTKGVPTDLSETWASLGAVETDRQVFAASGTLAICPGTWTVPLSLDGHGIAVVGIGGRDEVVLSGAGAVRVIQGASAQVTLDGLSVIDGVSVAAGGLVKVPSEGSWALTDLTLSGGSAKEGGAIQANAAGSLTVDDCTLVGNHADDGGAIAARESPVTIRSSAFTDNHATLGAGGGVAVYTASGQTLTIVDSTFEANSASHWGGAIIVTGYGYTELEGVVVSDNVAGDDGGGAYVAGQEVLSVYESTFTGNQSTGGQGGGLWGYPYRLDLIDVSLTDNEAGAEGGGGWLYGWPGKVFRLTATGNTAAGDGGGVYFWGSDTTVESLTLQDNEATAGCGGGVAVKSSVTWTLEQAEISGNRATGADGHGGGVCADSGLTVVETEITRNEATSHGAGLSVMKYGAVTLEDSWVRDHTAASGSAVWVGVNATLQCTASNSGSAGFTANQSADAAVRLDHDTSTLRSTSCAWGAPGQAWDNSADLMLPDGSVLQLGDDETFTCYGSDCG